MQKRLGTQRQQFPRSQSWRSDALRWIPTKHNHLSPESLGSPQNCTQQRGKTSCWLFTTTAQSSLAGAEPDLPHGRHSRSSPRKRTVVQWEKHILGSVYVEGPALCPVELVILAKSWNNPESLSSSVKTGDHLASRGCYRPRLGCPRWHS